jgi:hypothetical protein
MRQRLVPWPRAALLVLAGCVAVVGGLGALLHDDTHSNRFDAAIGRWIRDDLPAGAVRDFLHLTDPPLLIAVAALTLIVAVLVRRWDVAALVIVVPPVAVLLTEKVLKPMVARSNVLVTEGLRQEGALAYPSGHETATASVAAVIALFVLGAAVHRAWKMAWLAALAAVVVLAAIGLVGNFFHFATDTIGAVGVAVAITLATGLGVDRVRSAAPSRHDEQLAARH